MGRRGTWGRLKPSKVAQTSNVSRWPLREQLYFGIKQSRQISTVAAPFTLKAWDEVGERTPALPAPLPAPKDVRLRARACSGFT